MIDKAIKRSDAQEKALLKRLRAVYDAAFEKAIKDIDNFLKMIDDVESGKYRPPDFYNTPEKVAKWKQGFYRELIRKERVAANIRDAINEAGLEVSEYIKEMCETVYGINRDYTCEVLHTGMRAAGYGVDISFAQYDKKAIEVILHDTQPPFSKIAYKNLGKNPAIVRRLQNELIQATLLGEDQKSLIKRIKAVVGNAEYNARRTAQTERNRVQSQARSDTLHEAAGLGVNVAKTWSARMKNTRESHAQLDGITIPESEKFHTVWGNELAFPGDPSAPAREVINCYCVLMPDVLPPGETAPRRAWGQRPNESIKPVP